MERRPSDRPNDPSAPVLVFSYFDQGASFRYLDDGGAPVAGCASCVARVHADLADRMEGLVNLTVNPAIYCAGTVPLP
jgi:hypothetical protein